MWPQMDVMEVPAGRERESLCPVAGNAQRADGIPYAYAFDGELFVALEVVDGRNGCFSCVVIGVLV